MPEIKLLRHCFAGRAVIRFVKMLWKGAVLTNYDDYSYWNTDRPPETEEEQRQRKDRREIVNNWGDVLGANSYFVLFQIQRPKDDQLVRMVTFDWFSSPDRLAGNMRHYMLHFTCCVAKDGLPTDGTDLTVAEALGVLHAFAETPEEKRTYHSLLLADRFLRCALAPDKPDALRMQYIRDAVAAFNSVQQFLHLSCDVVHGARELEDFARSERAQLYSHPSWDVRRYLQTVLNRAGIALDEFPEPAPEDEPEESNTAEADGETGTEELFIVMDPFPLPEEMEECPEDGEADWSEDDAEEM